MSIGNTILELRKKKGITQEALAAEMGVTPAAVSKWENNCTLPDILMLVALADYFQVSTDELLGRKVYLKKAVIVALSESLVGKIEALTRQYGIISAFNCVSYDEAKKKCRENPDIEYIIIADSTSSSEDNYIEGSPSPENVKVYVCSGDTDAETLAILEMMLRDLKS